MVAGVGELRAAAGMIAAGAGCITNAKQAENVITSGRADLAFMSREHMRHPHVAVRMARELGVPPKNHVPLQLGFFVG